VGANVQFLEGALGFGGGHVKGIIGGESEPLHPHTQTGEETEIAAEDFAKSICLGGSELVGIHQWRVYSLNRQREGRKKEDLRVEQQTRRFSAE